MNKYTKAKSISLFAAFLGVAFVALPPVAIGAPAPVVLDRGPAADYAAALGGAYAQRIGDPLLAGRAYEKAWLRNPNNAELFSRLIDSFFTAGDVTNVARLAGRASPEVLSGEAKLTLAANALVAGNRGQVEPLITHIDLPAVRALFGRHLLAWSLIADGKKDEAIIIASRSSGNRIVDRNANYSRALMYQYLGDNNNAKISFETAFESGARASIGVVAYAEFLAANGEKAKALEILSLALANSEATEWLLEVKTKIANQSRPARLAAGNSASLKAYIAKSLGALSLGISQDPRGNGGVGEMALAYKFDSSALVLRLQMARVLFGSRLENEGKNILNSVPPDSVFSDSAIAARAQLMNATDKVGAEALMQRTATRRPNLANRYNLGILLLTNEKFRESEIVLTGLINEVGAKPIDETGFAPWLFYHNRSFALDGQDKNTAAIEDMRKALSIEPNNSVLLNALGYSLAQHNINLEESLSLLREAVRKSPRSGSMIDSLGWALFRLGRYPEALDQLETAFSLSPNSGVVAEHLGDAYYATDRKIEAQLEWRKAISLFEKPADIARVRQKLETGLPSSVPVTVANN